MTPSYLFPNKGVEGWILRIESMHLKLLTRRNPYKGTDEKVSYTYRNHAHAEDFKVERFKRGHGSKQSEVQTIA